MEDKSSLQTESVKIIQRNFRKYLNRKRRQKNSKETVENTFPESLEERRELSGKLSDVRNSLQGFYQKVFENAERDKYVDDLINKTDEISDRLKNINSLEACVKENLQNRQNPDISNEAKQRHEEKVRELGLPWWEKLNLAENVLQ